MFNQNHYVPIIRWKRGEQSALLELDSQFKDNMTPVIEIAPIDWDFENDCYKKTIDDHLKNLLSQIKNNWNHNNYLFIDALQICLEDDEVMLDGTHPLEYIFDVLTSENVNVIPVTSKDRGVNYHQAVESISKKYDTGFAIRLGDEDLDEVDLILEWFLKQYSSDPSKIDLIIDYKYLSSKTPVGRTTKLLSGTILSIPSISEWRTLTFAATTFPTNLSEFPTGTDGSIPRIEWLIYQELLKISLPRYPAFGDYVISNPEYSKIDPRLMRMSANIRYTADSEYLIFRGYSITSPKYGKWAQSKGLCQRVVANPKYSGKGFSYGDKYIYDCANGTESTGNAETWRKVGTNHHLTLVINELSNFHATLSVGSP
jgi:hypothetical protein